MTSMFRRKTAAILAACAVFAAGVAGFARHRTADMASISKTDALRVTVAPGYALQWVAGEFTAPVGVATGAHGEVYVAESGDGGHSARVLKVMPGRGRNTVATDFPAPLTGLTWHEGKLYVSYVGGIDVLDPTSGLHYPVLHRLPARGDHPNGAVAFSPDGKLYFGIGSATNSGVVGLDNVERGWVTAYPDTRDIPCKPMQLRGANFSVRNPLTPDPYDMITTGAFSAFGRTTARLQPVSASLPCNGAVLRANRDGSGLEMVAWGLRDPYGLAFSPDGHLFATNGGYEDRGSRPVVGDRDYLYRLEAGRWYGFPDFAGGEPVNRAELQKEALPAGLLLAETPEQPPEPLSTFPHQSDPKGLLFPPDLFGLGGDALVALAGPRGQAIARVSPRTGTTSPFVRNDRRSPDGPGLQRPYALAASANGEVYVIDYGQVRTGPRGPEPLAGTGLLLKLTRERRP